MSHHQILEHEFESNLCDELADRGWLYENAGEPNAVDWDIARAMVPADVLHWLATQYPDEYEKAVPSDLTNGALELAQRKLLDHIIKELGKFTKMDPITGHPVGGLLGVLRRGFKFAQIGRPAASFGPLMEFPPENPNLLRVLEQSDAVRLRVLRQVRFDTRSNETIDVVLCANGLPVATLELKTDNTQTVNHAIAQYKNDRMPGPTRALLQPGRVLVHFAVSNDLVYMTTKLQGAETFFLPFNQGTDGHAGNPPSETGSASNYLWREILARPTFMRIMRNFALFEPNRSKKGDGRLVFPRFHQLRAVERVVADIEQQGAGGRYLIWHSAGSGKTKTIAWLSHRLIRHVGKDAQPMFDSVIVVTDRTVLDENVRDDMNLVQSSAGLVVNIGDASGAKSAQVKAALLEGNHIITCTLQTFPHVMKLIEDTADLHGRRWAVVADEAHSSQSGSTARALKGLLVDLDLDPNEELSADDLLAATDSAIAASSNITFIALTATPKAKTLRLFGSQVPGEERWEAFDTYTMAQAIEEQFILDVLTNYSTYDMFLRVKNTLESEDDDTEVETGRAVKDIVRFTRLHPTAIAQKVQVVVEHFRRNVAHMLNGQARAMVVTSGRKEAVLWSEKMNAYIADKGYTGLETLVAFSGSVKNDAGEEVTEVLMNALSDVARAFREEDDYKVLIVANKFQTGFDEPRLMAMYVDKVLSDIATVQTLSRLNRMYPGKSAPMVVDFVNSPENIQKDFARYYTDARVEGEVDANALYELAERLDAVGLYTEAQMRAVAQAYIEELGGEAIQSALGPIKFAWSQGLQQARLTKDKVRTEELKQFRSDAISYRNAWQFLSQIVDYDDEDLRLRAVLMTLLARNLHLTPEEYDGSYMDGVQLGGVKLVPDKVNADFRVDYITDTGIAIELPKFTTEPGGIGSKPRGPLEEAIDTVNELFSDKGIDADPGSIAGFITAYWGFLDADEEAVAMAKRNNVEQLKGSTKFSDASDYAMFQAFQNTDEIKKALADPEVLASLLAITAQKMHTEHHEPGNGDA
ncbi:type I restriction endonuclease subunit R [Leucobacter chromiiresistens]|uniref:Type I restriction enzyme, R subunit n=1 Tax=Leucobacter chromiiresistens TaxID=1079994 RepID=A0A1H0Z4Z1_9MICO|nr:DEAD/DEAH box helicase family protein [Leucobacter chromiiresistens]SDQ22380.1 type I restriction enzyme, R subunit [Leucobacter chromiiresistens]